MTVYVITYDYATDGEIGSGVEGVYSTEEQAKAELRTLVENNDIEYDTVEQDDLCYDTYEDGFYAETHLSWQIHKITLDKSVKV